MTLHLTRERLATLVASSYLAVVAAVMIYGGLAIFVLAEPGDPVIDGVLPLLVTAPTSLLLLPLGLWLTNFEEVGPPLVGNAILIINVFVLPAAAGLVQAWLLWLTLRRSPARIKAN